MKTVETMKAKGMKSCASYPDQILLFDLILLPTTAAVIAKVADCKTSRICSKRTTLDPILA